MSRRGSIPLIDAAAAFLVFFALQMALMSLHNTDPCRNISSLIEEEELRNDLYGIIFSGQHCLAPQDGSTSFFIKDMRISVERPSCEPFISFFVSGEGGIKTYYITRAG